MRCTYYYQTKQNANRPGEIDARDHADALLEFAVMHVEEAEAERLREKLRKLTEKL